MVWLWMDLIFKVFSNRAIMILCCPAPWTCTHSVSQAGLRLAPPLQWVRVCSSSFHLKVQGCEDPGHLCYGCLLLLGVSPFLTFYATETSLSQITPFLVRQCWPPLWNVLNISSVQSPSYFYLPAPSTPHNVPLLPAEAGSAYCTVIIHLACSAQ